MTRTYLPRAVAAGARMVTGCRIDALEMRRRHAPAEQPPRWPTAAAGRITFRHVFVCGGAIQSPALLQRSRIAGHIGRSLAVHPTVKLAARFADELNVPDDVPVHQVKEFAPDLSFGGSASQPGPRGAGAERSVAHVRAARSPTGDGSACTTRPSPARVAAGSGRCRGLRDPIVTYGLTRPRSRAARQRAGPLGAADARGRRRRGVPVVPGRAARCATAATWRRCSPGSRRPRPA